jgi:hypothetical protein
MSRAHLWDTVKVDAGIKQPFVLRPEVVPKIWTGS